MQGSVLEAKARIAGRQQFIEKFRLARRCAGRSPTQRKRTSTVNGESTDARKFASEFINVVQPYDAFLRSNNIHPLQAVSALDDVLYTQDGRYRSKGMKLIATITSKTTVLILTQQQRLIRQRSSSR